MWNAIVDPIEKAITDKASTLALYAYGVLSWAAIIICILFILFYAGTLNKKFSSKATVAAISYIFVQVLGAVIK